MCGKCSNYSDDEFHVCLMLILSCAMISVSSEFLDTDIYIYISITLDSSYEIKIFFEIMKNKRLLIFCIGY